MALSLSSTFDCSRLKCDRTNSRKSEMSKMRFKHHAGYACVWLQHKASRQHRSTVDVHVARCKFGFSLQADLLFLGLLDMVEYVFAAWRDS
jgi:hypothetical protein